MARLTNSPPLATVIARRSTLPQQVAEHRRDLDAYQRSVGDKRQRLACAEILSPKQRNEGWMGKGGAVLEECPVELLESGDRSVDAQTSLTLLPNQRHALTPILIPIGTDAGGSGNTQWTRIWGFC